MAIFARDGVAIREALLTAALGMRPLHHKLPPPRPILVRGANGEGLRRYFKDKLGDIIHVWRALPLTSRNLRSWTGEGLRKIRAMHGVGRPAPRAVTSLEGITWPAPEQEHIEAPGLDRVWEVRKTAPLCHGQMHAALAEYGSQRAAARALGMNLSTFQRRLAKETA